MKSTSSSSSSSGDTVEGIDGENGGRDNEGPDGPRRRTLGGERDDRGRRHEPPLVLIIDDDKPFARAAAAYLTEEGLAVQVAHTRAEALALCAKDTVRVVVLDQRLPDGNGVDLCRPILERGEEIKIIFITAYASFENAVEAIKAGAYDYLSKPVDLEALAHSIRRALNTIDLERITRVQQYREQHERDETRLVGMDAGLREIGALIGRAARSRLPVLITGETGTGKTVVAKYLHYHAHRAGSERAASAAAFIAVNCAALPASLLEAELFGHVRGAFTGADHARRGVFEMADGGTLFLDEIGALPLDLQPKLLSALEEGRVRPIGAETARTVDVRLIAATNTELEAAVSQGRFRQDLYYRLNVIRLHLPPLRQRPCDIPHLCRHFLQELNRGGAVSIDESELPQLLAYPWPGNVRELRNVIDRALVLQSGGRLQLAPLLVGGAPRPGAALAPPEPSETLEAVERQHILATLARFNGNQTQTARALAISLSTLKRKLVAYGH